ncbi:FG-GAP-like repeat-containing protein [Streptomyces sp. BE147]|uniref:FG-GAP-like repeat-containing protein n=1 Tax=Streptomyces sp. BE147 TaxID=3002524 RepID=UPI002E79BA71|nr:FG-GAP-like repeat-containing protein [Streptomyces sp. BE147]MEE1740422.1 FG-GAP-like repeat-containing protein [Streptomyces sp. BE147]
MALWAALGFLAALLAAVPTAAPAVAAGKSVPPPAADRQNRQLVTGSWNMQGGSDGIGSVPESRWNTGIRTILRDEVDVATLQEAGNAPPESSNPSDRVFANPSVTEHVYRVGPDDLVQIYWGHIGQRRNALAIMTRETVRDADLILVNGEHDSRPILAVQIGETWYFSAHALSGGGVDAPEIIDRAYNFVRQRSPGAPWQVLADFNRNPGRMPARFQRHIVRSNLPTQYGGNELDWALISNGTDRTVTAERRATDSDHYYIRYTFNRGCLAPQAARSETAAEECLDPVAGHTYWTYTSSSKWPGHAISSGTLWNIPHVEEFGKDDEDAIVEVLFSVRPDRYVLKTRDGCITRDESSEDTAWGDCDQEAEAADWAFSDGKIVDPYANGPSFLQPTALGDRPDFPYLITAPEPHVWWFVETGTGDPGDGTGKPDIRLMPVGDSITFGVGSSDGNGYREKLWDPLDDLEFHPDFVGSNHSGDMSDPEHNGHRGWVIDEIAEPAALDSRSMRPNVVTLMAGTNDIYRNEDVAGAPARLGRLIDRMQSGSPGVAIAVATLVPVKDDPVAQDRRNAYNEQVRSLVEARQNQGQKIVLAELGPMTDSMLLDQLHPNDDGYTYMADRFVEAVMKMVELRWVAEPADPGDGGDPDMCVKNPGGGWSELGRIAQGPIPADSATAGVKGSVRLADFDGNGRTDYAVLTDTGAVYLWTRTADGWEDRGKVAEGNGAAGRGGTVRLADLDKDHDADYLAVHENGAVEAFRNDGVREHGNSGWHSMGLVAEGTGHGGGAEVRFADIDADGDADYLLVHDDGSVEAWLNDDVLVNGKSAWTKLGVIAAGTGNPGSKVRLADLDGDADADYLVVHEDGRTEAWLNDDVAGKLGKGWTPIGKIAAGTGPGGPAVRFADFDADGDADYFVVGSAGTATVWENLDVATRPDKENGFKKVGVYGRHMLDAAAKARVVRFADLDGDGDDDYLLVGPRGEVEAWRNDDVGTKGTNAWIKVGKVAEGVSPGEHERVVFADYDGDRRDDYLVVDDTNGRVRGWHNDAVFSKGITAWTGVGVIAQGPTGAGEREVQFADIDGDGDDDYLLVSADHSVHGWQNKGTDAPGGGGWALPALIARPKDPVPAQQRTVFASMTCDDRADYVLRDPDRDNALYSWRNLGGFDNEWSSKKKIAYGVAMSFPVENHLADLDGDGLDDYLVVDPKNGAARAWLNNGGNQAAP